VNQETTPNGYPVDAGETGQPTRTPLREGAKTLDLAAAAVQCAETGLPVTLKL
jgi:hypothetical protein